MDSEDFQKKIDDQVRNEASGSKGKEKEAEARQEEKEERNENVEEENIEMMKSKARPPALHQSKRKNGQPAEPAPQTIGPIRIKKPKQAVTTSKEGPNQPSNPTQKRIDSPPALENPQQQQTEDPDVELDGPRHKDGNLGSYKEEGSDKEKGKVLGGIYLDDDEGDLNETQVQQNGLTTTERMHQRLDAEIEEAFRRGDRVLYDQLSTDKRRWSEFANKGQRGEVEEGRERINNEVLNRKEVKVVRGKQIVNDLVSLSPYWSSAMKDLSRYIPLSIFDPAWLRQDLNLTSNKSSRAKSRDADAISYNGSPVPSEWRTSVAQWHRQKDLFLEHLLHYKHTEVIDSMKEHFRNVLEIQKENDGCWVMAFRYDIEMRQTYLTFRVGDEEAMADIGVRNRKIEKRAERQTVMRRDDLFLDNPYAIGQRKQYIDPIDGTNWEGRGTTWDDPGRGETKEAKQEVSKSSQSVRSALWAQARSEPHTLPTPTPTFTNAYTVQPPTQPANYGNNFSTNYRGKNYIPNYRANYKGGRGGGADTNGPNDWGRGRQGEAGGSGTLPSNRGGMGRGTIQKK
ncbi:hypothetical protein DFH28DRAFT_901946 [Melampsora americana]|nr:hypothetical protein DFH28DRAFT_901946 [Melampsora americana]